MNIRILQDVEKHMQRGEIAQTFVQKWAEPLTGVFCVMYPESLTLHVPTNGNGSDVVSKIGDIFGIGGWNKERNSFNYFKTVDGVKVEILNAALIEKEPEVTNVSLLTFSPQPAAA